jgi:hypothetical protein
VPRIMNGLRTRSLSGRTPVTPSAMALTIQYQSARLCVVTNGDRFDLGGTRWHPPVRCRVD